MPHLVLGSRAATANIEFEYKMVGKCLLNVESEKDLGGIINKDLKPHEQCVEVSK